MHIPDGYLSPHLRRAVCRLGAILVHRSATHEARLEHPDGPAALGVRRVLVHHHDVQSAAAGRHNRACGGSGIAAIVLGPWASILAISIALVIQAIFFGDGGITAIGANCFNMAIVGSLTAYAIYRVDLRSRADRIAPPRGGGRAGRLSRPSTSPLLLAAIEFGIQPLLYHDASGAPLYAPYPLHIAIPAMMIGHLTVAGLAEMVVSAGVVAYLQRAEPSLLRNTAPGADRRRADRDRQRLARHQATVDRAGGSDGPDAAGNSRSRIGLGRMVSRRLSNPGAAADRGRFRQSGASRASARRAAAPGLVLDRAHAALRPALFEERSFGYMLSAMAGTGLIILVFLLPAGSRAGAPE